MLFRSVELLMRLKERGLSDRVLLGGRGLTTTVFDTVEEFLPLTDEERELDFVDVLKRYQLVSNTVLGDGEDAVLDFLKTGHTTTQKYVTDIKKMHYPDYSDYTIDQYLWANNLPHMLVTGSAGCVRDCDFCDVNKQFGRFRFKDGTQLAEELI